MEELRLGAVEARFAEIVWRHAPLPSGALVKLCQQELAWKKSTTYTVLKKLCDRGLFQNIDGVVSARLTREEFCARQSEQFVRDNFDGSLPAFIAAFTTRNTLSPEELRQLRQMVDSYGEE